jgi:hypothetical protein
VANSTGSLTTRVGTIEANYVTSAGLSSYATQSFVNTSVANSTASLSTRVSTIEAAYVNSGTLGNYATQSFVNTAVANSTGSLSSSIASLTSQVGTLSTTVTQFSSSINGIQGKYGVTISGSAVTGFELIGGGSTSDFIVSANTFKIKTSSGTLTPFTVSGDTVSIDGSVQVGATLSSGNVTNGVVIDGNGMKVYAGGVLRVHIGNLSA